MGMIVLSKSASFLLQSKCVSNLAASNKVAIGRVLPVFLAILFMGGSEQTIHMLPDLSLGLHPRSGRSTPASPRISSRSTRTALCLLPALLKQACQASTQDDFRIAFPVRATRIQSLAPLPFTGESAVPSFKSAADSTSLWQRPPPLV